MHATAPRLFSALGLDHSDRGPDLTAQNGANTAGEGSLWTDPLVWTAAAVIVGLAVVFRPRPAEVRAERAVMRIIDRETTWRSLVRVAKTASGIDFVFMHHNHVEGMCRRLAARGFALVDPENPSVFGVRGIPVRFRTETG